MSSSQRRLGIAFVGAGGAVATTAVAGIETMKAGSNSTDGLPLADLAVPGMAAYRDISFGGWDLNGDDLDSAAATHGVLDGANLGNGVGEAMRAMRPWPAVGNAEFCRNVVGSNVIEAKGHRDAIRIIRGDLDRFRRESGADGVVVVNLASTERWPDTGAETFRSLDAFERGLDADDAAISPAMLYAYAAIADGLPYGNFTPSFAGDAPALIEFAKRTGAPLAGKDGKTGQTMIKTVLAPALKSRALHVDGWFSTNILGNRDGLALDDKDSLDSKLKTKGSVLDDILGYKVEDHVVHIHYYRPRGDDKEAWDNIDVTGFLGKKMQLKVNFLCKDSILAAPLVIEIARVLDLAKQRGEGGVIEELGLFFKAPMVRNGHAPEHAFHAQEAALLGWLGVK